MLSKLAPQAREAVAANLAKVKGHGLTLGTMCSGTDVGAEAIACLVEVACKELEVGAVSYRNMFACEITPYKQKFLKAFATPEAIFDDVTKFGENICFDVKSGGKKVVRPVSTILAGFSCTDVSHMNKRSQEARDCVQDKSLRTGSTMDGISKYIEQAPGWEKLRPRVVQMYFGCFVCLIPHCQKSIPVPGQARPAIVILENVTAIADSSETGTSNASVIMQSLESKGYVGRTVQLSPMVHGVPHRRRRLWFVYLLVGSGPVSRAELQAWAPILDKMVEIITHQLAMDPPPLSFVLMDESSADLVEWEKSESTRAAKFGDEAASSGNSKKKPEWNEVHEQAFHGAGLVWPPTFHLRYPADKLQRLMRLPQRARECVFFADATGDKLENADDEEVIDVQQGLMRLPKCHGASPCILPNSTLWLRKRGRKMYPNECLHLQSLPLRSRQEYSEFSSSELMSLAGNAFCGHNVMAIFLAVLAVYQWPEC